MTREDIIAMALEAKLPYYYRTGEVSNLDQLERFFRMAQAAEREACAKEAEAQKCHMVAHAIRARGEPEQEPVKRTVMYRPSDLEALGLTHEDVVKLIKGQACT